MDPPLDCPSLFRNHHHRLLFVFGKFDESSQSCLANDSVATFVLQLLVNSDVSVAKFAEEEK